MPDSRASPSLAAIEGTLRLVKMTGDIDPWGHSGRHYAEPMFQQGGIYVSKWWERTVESVAPGSRDTVTRAVSTWNQRVRNRLSVEMAFQLKGRQVPIKVVDGLPAPLSQVLEPADSLAEVVLNQPLLRGVVAGTRFMEYTLDGVRGPTGEVVGPATLTEITKVRETAEAWLRLVKDHDLSQALRRINEDVLGAYYFHRREIGIFWMAIGLFSALYGISAEALTIVVLAHELAHAYTHLGYDIDDFDWPTNKFASTDVAVVEGLAQYYAEVVCKNLESQMPEAIQAFGVLLTHQHEVYKTHRTWVDERDRNSGEIIRVSLVECRRSKKTMGRLDFAETVSKRRAEITG